MSVINAVPLLAAAGGDYQISRSVRLRSSATAYFSRTPASTSNQKTYTWSGWVKLGALANGGLFEGYSSGTLLTGFQTSSGTLVFQNYNSASYNLVWQTTAVYRDPSAWYHVVLSVDMTQASSANAVKLYVNGVAQVLTFTAYLGSYSANMNTYVNTVSIPQHIGLYQSTPVYLDGYLAETFFIDGQALTPSSFGENDAVTGVWKPKKYAGTYGTNGFYLNFADNSAATAAAIGKDYSGNGNNWTPNNISVTAGTTYDSMIDVPTMYADGGNGHGNYATVNPLSLIGTASTVSNGNLTQVEAGANNSTYLCTMAIPPNSGKWYFEMTATAISGSTFYPVTGLFPVGKEANSVVGFAGYAIDGIAYYASGSYYANASSTALTGTAVGATGNTRCFAYDSNTGKLWTRVNGGAWENSGDPVAGTNPLVTLSTAFSYFPYSSNNSSTNNANFGQRPFAYTPPTGFLALNTQNLPDSTIKAGNKYFDATAYTGNGGTLSVVNSGGFQPDLVWIKNRSTAGTDNVVVDSVRGSNGTTYHRLFTDLTNAESDNNANSVSALNSNGFTVIGTSPNLDVNENAKALVGWQWKKGATQGFDIVTYTGTGVAHSINHSLGVVPAMMIVKSRGAVANWGVYHQSLAANEILQLNLTNSVYASSTVFNDQRPTSSVFYVGATPGMSNTNGTTYVCYLFSEVAGFSKFGSYTGNGSADGPFGYCGFRPRFILVKRTDAAYNWFIFDSARNTYNVATQFLQPNASSAEGGTTGIDITSNGFKLRDTSIELNASGGTYIFAAFAENPFKNSLAR